MPRSRLFHFPLSATFILVAAAALAAQQPVAAPQRDATMGLKRDPALAAPIAEFSAAQIRIPAPPLVSFGPRHAMSNTTNNSRGIGAARRYLFARLSGYSKACGGCLKVEYDPAM